MSLSGYFEDVSVGDSMELGSYEFTAEKIIRFAAKYDPQPFHLSEEEAAKTHFGRLCASGWHTASVYMRLLVLTLQEMDKNAIANGKKPSMRGPSPGFEDLRWIKPVYAGDTITYRQVVTGKRESQSRPEWGILNGENQGVNQNGELVFAFKSAVFLQRRPKEGS